MSTNLQEVFEKRYKSLNKAQKQAVDTLEGPILVVAGPGTGKTTILTLRIANILLKTDTPPSGILAITFTDAGVKAMKEKLRSLIGSRADEVRIHTFHGFAASIIGEYRDHFVHLSNMRQMTDIDAESLVRKILTEEAYALLCPLGNPDFYIRPILEGVRDCKKEALSPEMVKQFAKEEKTRIEQDPESISSRGATKGQFKGEAKKKIEKCDKTLCFAEVYAEYEKQKKAKNLMDFDDLIFELLLAFGRDELLLRIVQEKFLYILVDEHQDTNDSQNLIIKMLADFFPNPNVFIVGDEKQAIYRFQGASVENFLSFEKRWPTMNIISLEHNYRSHQSILDATFGMIERNYNEGEHEKLRIKLVAGAKIQERPINVVQSADVETGEKYIVRELKRISTDEPEKTVAIISKTNRDVERMIRICQSEGLAVSAERSIDIFSHPIGLTFFALIQYLADQTDAEALGRTLSAGLWDLPFADCTDLLKQLRARNFTGIEEKLSALSDIRKLMSDDSPITFLICAVEKSGLLKVIARDSAYIEVWRGILGLAEQIVKQESIQDPLMLVSKLLDYKASSEMKSVKVKVGVPEAQISIMTAHGSKGLEYDYVFIPYATEESWSSRARAAYFVFPFQNLIQDGDEIRDIRRLFYVALTRAKEHAEIVVPVEDAGGELLTPLRFISELDPAMIQNISLPKEKGDLVLAPSSMKISTTTAIEDYAKHVLQEYGLSVTALNHFLTCPSQFLYKSILKLPEAPSATAEKGIAMHLAINRIWNSKDKSVEMIENIMRETIEENVDASFLFGNQKEQVKKELLKDVPAVASSLASHFALQGEVFPEHWARTVFNAQVDGKEIEIPLHGKLDAIIDNGKTLFVFDYKTRGKMSANEIKGETKNSDGNYFRQLVFYKILLEGQPNSKGKEVVPSLIFLSPDTKGVCHSETLPIEKTDIDDVKSKVQSLVDSVWAGRLMSDRCSDDKCEWCNLKKLIA